MAYGIKGDDTMPAGRKAFGMNTNATGRTFDQAGAKLPTDAGQEHPPGARQRTIRPHKFGDGQDAMGTPKEHVHGKVSTGYNDPTAHQYRAELRGHTSKKGHSNHG
jgi:hypothetical protein